MNPFTEFIALLGEQGKELLEKFFLVKKGYYGTDEVDNSLEYEIPGFDTDFYGEPISFKWSYEQELRPHITRAIDEADKKIANTFFSLQDTQQQKAFLIKCLDFIKSLQDQAAFSPARARETEAIRKGLYQLARIIARRYKSFKIEHEIFELSTAFIQQGSPTMDLKIKQVKELVSVLVELGFIDEDSEKIETLKDFLRDPAASNGEQEIMAMCSLQKAAYILSKIATFYKETATLKQLLNFKVFTIRGKPINYDSCISSKSRYIKNQKSDAERAKIDELFSSLFM